MSLEQFAKFQDQLREELAAIDARLAEHENDYGEARHHIEDCLALASDIGRVYAVCSDQNRRLANQAFFTRIRIGEHRHIDAVAAKPFNVILDSEVRHEALSRSKHDLGIEGALETATFTRVSQFRTSQIGYPRKESNPRHVG